MLCNRPCPGRWKFDMLLATVTTSCALNWVQIHAVPLLPNKVLRRNTPEGLSLPKIWKCENTEIECQYIAFYVVCWLLRLFLQTDGIFFWAFCRDYDQWNRVPNIVINHNERFSANIRSITRIYTTFFPMTGCLIIFNNNKKQLL